ETPELLPVTDDHEDKSRVVPQPLRSLDQGLERMNPSEVSRIRDHELVSEFPIPAKVDAIDGPRAQRRPVGPDRYALRRHAATLGQALHVFAQRHEPRGAPPACIPQPAERLEQPTTQT